MTHDFLILHMKERSGLRLLMGKLKECGTRGSETCMPFIIPAYKQDYLFEHAYKKDSINSTA